MKTEPDLFSIQDLANSPDQTASWIGVRNYQARNFMRDQMELDDRVLIYHSNAKPSCVVGIATIAKTSHADYTAWDKTSQYFDPKSSPENPRWQMVDVKLESIFSVPQSLEMLRAYPKLAEMVLLKKGMRLSIQPVTKQEFELIEKIGKQVTHR